MIRDSPIQLFAYSIKDRKLNTGYRIEGNSSVMHGILRNVNFVAQGISRTTDREQILSASTIQGYSSVTSLHGEKLLFEDPRGEEGLSRSTSDLILHLKGFA